MLDCHAGSDRLQGGDGNDLLHPDSFESPSADVVDGGLASALNTLPAPAQVSAGE